MLTHPLHRLLDSVFLRLTGGDAIRADELRARTTASFLAFMMASYLPLAGAVLLLIIHRPQPVDENAARDQMTMVEDYSMRYVNTYLKDPSNTAAIKQFYDGDVPASALPPGGRALWAASALPGVVVDGFRTYSVIVTAEIPKAANSASMVPMKLDLHLGRHQQPAPRGRTSLQPGRPSIRKVRRTGHVTSGVRGSPGLFDGFGLPFGDVDRRRRHHSLRRIRVVLDGIKACAIHHAFDRTSADEFGAGDRAVRPSKGLRNRGQYPRHRADAERRPDAHGLPPRDVRRGRALAGRSDQRFPVDPDAH